MPLLSSVAHSKAFLGSCPSQWVLIRVLSLKLRLHLLLLRLSLAVMQRELPYLLIWGQLWSKNENVIGQSPISNVQHRNCLSLCKCRISASWFSWQLLCWEKPEPHPLRCRYSGLGEENSCEHTAWLIQWFVSDLPLSKKAPLLITILIWPWRKMSSQDSFECLLFSHSWSSKSSLYPHKSCIQLLKICAVISRFFSKFFHVTLLNSNTFSNLSSLPTLSHPTSLNACFCTHQGGY